MNLEDKNSQTCQLVVINQGLGNISERPKQHCIQTRDHCLRYLGVESGLGPKIKFVVLHSNFNFHLRSNLKTSTEVKALLGSKQHHDKA